MISGKFLSLLEPHFLSCKLGVRDFLPCRGDKVGQTRRWGQALGAVPDVGQVPTQQWPPYDPAPLSEEPEVLMLFPVVPAGQDLGPLPLHHLLHLLCPGAPCLHPVLLQGEATVVLPKER